VVRLVSPKLTRNMGEQIAQRPAVRPGITASMQRERSVEGRRAARRHACMAGRGALFYSAAPWVAAIAVDVCVDWVRNDVGGWQCWMKQKKDVLPLFWRPGCAVMVRRSGQRVYRAGASMMHPWLVT
jgi:hypothetical protein